MSLRFIYGRAGTGKSYFCFQDIKKRIEEGSKNPLILLVPEDYSFYAEKELLRFVGDIGIAKARVLSFKRMAHAVFSEVGGITRRHMNSAGKCMLIYRIMDELKGKFKAFEKSAKLPGFINTMADVITELKIYDVTPTALNEAAEGVEDEMLKEKLEDMSLIYSNFENILHQGYIDSEDDLTILASKMDKSHMFDGAEVWMDGFSMLTPQQCLVLEKLFKKAKRVNITLTMDSLQHRDSGEDIFSSIRRMEERIVKIAISSNISFDKPVDLNNGMPYKFKDNPELIHLEKNLYAYPCEKYEDSTKNISIFKAVNKYTEVENTARDIIRLCRDENYRFGDIAVVTNDVEGYERLVAAIFSEYSIPYFIDKKRDINGNPLIVLILSAIETLCKNWTYEPLFRYLKTGLVGIDREDIDLIENYVLASGIKGKRWIDQTPWDYWPYSGFNGKISDDAAERLKRINEIRQSISEPLISLSSAVSESANVRDICCAIFEFLCSIGVPGRIEKMVDEFRNSGELDEASEYSKVWNIMIETLDQIVEVLGDEQMGLDQFARVLSIGFGEYNIGLIPPSLDQVMFGSAERIKSRTVKALYIMGVNDGIFPSAAPEEGILSDSDRELLKEMGVELAPGSKDKIFDQQYLVYMAFTRPKEYLKISYPIADHEGRTLRHSRIITRLQSIFKNISQYSNITVDDTDQNIMNLINEPLPTLNELVCAFRKKADGKPINPLWNDVYKWYIKRSDWHDRCQMAMSGINYSNMAPSISSERIRDLYGKNLRFSISRLEKYAACPFSYFMQYGLKANERKIYELAPPDMGSFIHTILDSFSKYLDEKNISWREINKEQCSQIVSDLVDSTVEGMSGSILTSSARYKYLKDRLKKIIFRAVWLISVHIKRGQFEPLGYEVSFEDRGKYPPISIELPSGEKLSLIGRIDRVDKMETEDAVYVRIVDYKSGNKNFNLSDIYNGLELQLLIYLDAILEYASKNSGKPVIPGGILYFRIDDPIVKAEEDLSEEKIEEEIMKKLKMKGLLLSDVKVVREMDKDMDGYSVIIPANVKAGSDNFGPHSSVADQDGFNALRKHVKDRIINLCEEMLSGNISISPYKKKNDTPCKYCNYKAVCRFDITINENKYRIIRDKKSDEIWDDMKRNVLKEGEA